MTQPNKAIPSQLAASELVLPLSQAPDWPQWAEGEYEKFANMINDEERPFPCFFAPEAARKNLIAYSWLDASDIAEPHRLVVAVDEYLAADRFRSNRSALVVFCQLPPGRKPEETLWSALQHLHDHDSEPWPPSRPKDPQDHDWSYCYRGEALFINGHSSQLKKRRSRHTSCDLALIFQRSSNFDGLISANEPTKIQMAIRCLVHAYDEIAVSPAIELPHTHPESRAWKAYWLGDSNEVTPNKLCPLQIRPR